MTNIRSILGWSCLCLWVVSCNPAKDQEQVDAGPTPLSIPLPAHLPAMPIPSGNPLTVEGVALGKQLFNDPILSINNRVSCGTCHKPDIAFADGQALSTLGVTGVRLPRHTPTLQNLAWHTSGLFWDGGVRNLESLSAAPIQEHDEMGQNMIVVVNLLNRSGDYKAKFRKAFGTDSVTQSGLLKALAQYMRTLVSVDSKYDRYRAGQATLTAQELDGLQIVTTKCSPCHEAPFFTDHLFHNNGLQEVYNDPYKEGIRMGRYRITFYEPDRGAFKTPTLRNIMVSAPYMHDGRIADIDAVLEHYYSHVVESQTLDTLLNKPGQQLGVPLSTTEKAALKAFFATLTDPAFLTQ